ncbi:hypothetical protein Tco_1432107 [Tanacetum coccineum]
MGRDTIQLEDVVSTISGEYLLEFTSEYGIPEGLDPELPGLEETIVDFPKGKVSVYTKFFEFANYRIPLSQFLFDILRYDQIHMSQLSVIGATKVDERIFPTIVAWHTSAPKDEMPPADSYSSVVVTTFNTRQMDLFNLISAPNPLKVKTKLRPRAAHEDGLSGEIPPVENPTVTEVVPKLDLGREVAAMGPLVNKRRRQRGNDEADANAPPKVLRKDHAASRPTQSTLGGKSLASMGLEAGSTFSAPAS